MQHFITSDGWRATHLGVGVFCVVTHDPAHPDDAAAARRSSPCVPGAAAVRRDTLGLKPNTLQALLAIAGVACCVAMAMPQVHIVAYCGDLGYGVARGAEMLSLMLGLRLIAAACLAAPSPTASAGLRRC